LSAIAEAVKALRLFQSDTGFEAVHKYILTTSSEKVLLYKFWARPSWGKTRLYRAFCKLDFYRHI